MKFSNSLKVLLVAAGLVSVNAYADVNTDRGTTAARCSGVYAAVAGFAQQTKDAATFNDAQRRGTLYLEAAYVYLPKPQANQIAMSTADIMTKSIVNGHPENVVKMMQACDAWAKSQSQ